MKTFFACLLLFPIIAVGSRSFETEAISLRENFKVNSTFAAGQGYVKTLSIVLKNLTSIDQNVTVKVRASNVNCTISSGTCSIYLGAATGALGSTLEISNTQLISGRTTNASSKMVYQPNLRTVGSGTGPDTMVYFSADLEIFVDIAEDNGAIAGHLSEISNCNGGCFKMDDGINLPFNNFLAAITASSFRMFPFNGGKAF